MTALLRPKNFGTRSFLIFVLVGPLVGWIAGGMLLEPIVILIVCVFGGPVAILTWAIYFGVMLYLFKVSPKSNKFSQLIKRQKVYLGMLVGGVVGAMVITYGAELALRAWHWGWLPGLVCGGLSVSFDYFSDDRETAEDIRLRELRKQEALEDSRRIQ